METFTAEYIIPASHVIPTQAGIQSFQDLLDPGLCRGDNKGRFSKVSNGERQNRAATQNMMPTPWEFVNGNLGFQIAIVTGIPGTVYNEPIAKLFKICSPSLHGRGLNDFMATLPPP